MDRLDVRAEEQPPTCAWESSFIGTRFKNKEGNDLVLGWNTAQPAFHQVMAGVFDGDTVRHVDLTTAFQHQNSVVLTHSTGNVQVVITTLDQSGRSMKQTAGFTDSAAVIRDMSSSTEKKEDSPSATSVPQSTKTHRAKRHHR